MVETGNVERGTIHTFIVDYDVIPDDQRLICECIWSQLQEVAHEKSWTQLTGSRDRTLGPLDLGRTFRKSQTALYTCK